MDAERNRNNNDNPVAPNQDEDTRTVMRVPSFFYALFVVKCKNKKMKKKKKTMIKNSTSCLHLNDDYKVRSRVFPLKTKSDCMKICFKTSKIRKSFEGSTNLGRTGRRLVPSIAAAATEKRFCCSYLPRRPILNEQHHLHVEVQH